MMTVWGASATRPTRDIDLLGYLPNQVESLVEIIREVCRQKVEPDALHFDPHGPMLTDPARPNTRKRIQESLRTFWLCNASHCATCWRMPALQDSA
jgi:hypothetical protein